jgi:WD40 repeat protein
LNLIATSRSNVVIITLAREIAKHVQAQSGTAAVTSPRTPAPSQTSIVIKNEQKNEILRLIKILIEKCPHDVAELILEVTDITLNCIDLNALRHKGIQAVSETFGLLLRYPMVTYCNESPKLCVGTKTGVLALYDLKTPKYQPFQAHPKNEVITCIQFSPDGKYLASYSAYEGILYFWQSANTFFGSSNTIHLVSRHAAQRLDRSIPSPMKKVDLNWLDRTTVRMYWHVDKSEKKFTV